MGKGYRMSQLSIQLTVISHNKDAIERVLNYPCEFTTIRELFFHELTQIVAYDEARWIHSITSQSAVALDRTYYTTNQQILTALDGHGIVYANGFDDGSAETGSLLCGWNEIIYEGCKYDAQKLASDSNCKCKAGRIHSYKDEQLIDYYVRTLPESEKQSYEDSMESIRQNMLHDFELKLSKYQNELAKVTVEADQTIQFSKKKFWSYLLQHSATYDGLKKKLQVCGGKFAFSLFNADYYVITPYKAGASMDNLTDVAHALVEIDKAISEILSVIKTRKRYPALKIISLEMLEKP